MRNAKAQKTKRDDDSKRQTKKTPPKNKQGHACGVRSVREALAAVDAILANRKARRRFAAHPSPFWLHCTRLPARPGWNFEESQNE